METRSVTIHRLTQRRQDSDAGKCAVTCHQGRTITGGGGVSSRRRLCRSHQPRRRAGRCQTCHEPPPKCRARSVRLGDCRQACASKTGVRAGNEASQDGADHNRRGREGGRIASAFGLDDLCDDLVKHRLGPPSDPALGDESHRDVQKAPLGTQYRRVVVGHGGTTHSTARRRLGSVRRRPLHVLCPTS